MGPRRAPSSFFANFRSVSHTLSRQAMWATFEKALDMAKGGTPRNKPLTVPKSVAVAKQTFQPR